MRRCWITLAAGGCAAGVAGAQVSFVDNTAGSGIGPYQMAAGMIAGAAAADIDNDGDIDLFIPNALGVADQLYINQGDGVFSESAAAAGVASTENSRGALFFDMDGDRDLDLVVVADRHLKKYVPQASTFILYEQTSPGTFTDVTAGSGLDVLIWDPMQPSFPPGNHAAGMAAGDLDNDGALDLVLTYWGPGSLTHVFTGGGDGTFVDTTATSLIAQGSEAYWQPVIHDFDRDGWMDIYVAVDFGPNQLWINQGDGTFTDQAPALGVDNSMNDMGVALGDYDNDGDMDVFVTNIHDPFYDPSDYEGRHNVLFRNDTVGGTLAFAEVSEALGVDKGDWGWGATWIDGDRDGLLDLAHTNGINRPGFETDTSRFFRNVTEGAGPFDDISAHCNFDDTDRGTVLISFDADRDGDLDMLQGCNPSPVRLVENTSLPGSRSDIASWLVVRPRLCGPNTHALGAVVRTKVGNLVRSRVITAGTSSFGQEPAEAHFGLDSAAAVDTITIEWPGGVSTILSGVGINQIITVAPGCSGDIDKDCDVDVFDFAELAAAFGQTVPRHADLDLMPDGEINVFDFAELAASFGCEAP